MFSKIIGLCGAVAALVCFPPATEAYEFEGDPYFKLGLGVTFSEGYHEMLEDYREDEDWDWGWIDVSAGVEFPISERFAFLPGAAFYFSYPDDDLNFLLVPSLALKIYFPNGGSLTDIWYPDAKWDYYLQFEANYVIPHAENDDIDLDNEGIGGAILLGIQLPYDWDLAIGGSYLPVSDDFDDDRNLGGFVVRLSRVLW
ncbi:MAG: hypothetical protein R6X19_08320 [Kiritimatiellia bacterium]